MKGFSQIVKIYFYSIGFQNVLKVGQIVFQKRLFRIPYCLKNLICWIITIFKPFYDFIQLVTVALHCYAVIEPRVR